MSAPGATTVTAAPVMAALHNCSHRAPDLGNADGEQVLEGQSFTCSCGRTWVSQLVMDRGSAPKANWVSTTAPTSTTPDAK